MKQKNQQTRAVEALERIAIVLERWDRRREQALVAQMGVQSTIGDAMSLMVASGHNAKNPGVVEIKPGEYTQMVGRGMKRKSR